MNKLRFITAALHVLVILIMAAALTSANSRVKINYCKSTIKHGSGIAVLKEDSVSAAVITLGDTDNVTGRANILLNDPFGLSVKSVHDLFSDDDGNLYFFCTVYGLNRSEAPQYETIYKCNFTLGSAAKIWSSKDLKGYTVNSGGVPYIKNGEIFIPMTNENSGSVDILKFSGNTHSTVIENCDELDSDTIIYRGGKVFRAKDSVGVFVNGEKILDDPNGIYDALTVDNSDNSDNAALNFIDIANNKIYHYKLSDGTLFGEPLSAVFSETSGRLQRLCAYSDGTITAALEDGESLRAYRIRGAAESVFSLVYGGVFARSFVMFTVLLTAAAGLLWLLYTLLFVRIRRQDGGARRYRSIAAGITALSTAAGIVCAVIFGILINGTVDRLNTSFRGSIDTNGSQFLAGYIFSECTLEINKNGLPELTGESKAKLEKTIANYRAALAANDRIDCEFILFAEHNGKIYRIGDRSGETFPAEYEVSLRAVELIRKGIESGTNCAFEDKMTAGFSKYTCTNFPIYDSGGETHNGVLCTVTDIYRTRLTSFVLYLWLLAVIFGLVILLLITANIVLRRSLSGLKRLRRAFGQYDREGDPEIFLLNKNNKNNNEFTDEITETGHALMLMTEGTKVHAREIGEGNRKYKRFMSAGILKLLDRSEISKVNFGDRSSANALIMRFTPKRNCDVSKFAQLINDFLEQAQTGALLNFSANKADLCFPESADLAKLVEAAPLSEHEGSIAVTFGKVESGSAGSAHGAWLIALSEEFCELKKIENSEKNSRSKTVFVTAKAAEKLKDLNFEMRPKNDYFEVIFSGKKAENESENESVDEPKNEPENEPENTAENNDEGGEENESENVDNGSGDPAVDGSLDPVV